MARRGRKIICDDSYCGRVIPEQRFDCGKHSAPKELRPFVETNRRRAARHEQGKGASGELWTPQKAHECVRERKFPADVFLDHVR